MAKSGVYDPVNGTSCLVSKIGVAERVMILLLEWINEMSQLQLQSDSQERAA